MSSTIQIKRGLAANLPASAAAGELVYTTDDQKLHVGTGGGIVNLKIAAADVIGLGSQVESINAQTGTTYALQATDAQKLVTLANAASVAVSIANALLASGQWVDFENKGPGVVTITPTGATVDGNATFVLNGGQGTRLIFDGTNFQVEQGKKIVTRNAVATQFVTGVTSDGVLIAAQPAFTDVSGQITGAQLPAVIDGGTF